MILSTMVYTYKIVVGMYVRYILGHSVHTVCAPYVNILVSVSNVTTVIYTILAYEVILLKCTTESCHDTTTQ